MGRPVQILTLHRRRSCATLGVRRLRHMMWRQSKEHGCSRFTGISPPSLRRPSTSARPSRQRQRIAARRQLSGRRGIVFTIFHGLSVWQTRHHHGSTTYGGERFACGLESAERARPRRRWTLRTKTFRGGSFLSVPHTSPPRSERRFICTQCGARWTLQPSQS